MFGRINAKINGEISKYNCGDKGSYQSGYDTDSEGGCQQEVPRKGLVGGGQGGGRVGGHGMSFGSQGVRKSAGARGELFGHFFEGGQSRDHGGKGVVDNNGNCVNIKIDIANLSSKVANSIDRNQAPTEIKRCI